MRYYKSFILFSLLALVFVACDTDDLEKDIDALKDRVASVEAQVQRLNDEMNILRVALDGNKTITAVSYTHLVPLKLESTYSSGTVTDKDIARTDKNVIYKFIVKEMEEAADEGLLSAKDLGYKPNRISKSAAWGILARVYLFWAGEHNRDDQPEPAEAKSYFEPVSYTHLGIPRRFSFY